MLAARVAQEIPPSKAGLASSTEPEDEHFRAKQQRFSPAGARMTLPALRHSRSNSVFLSRWTLIIMPYDRQSEPTSLLPTSLIKAWSAPTGS